MKWYELVLVNLVFLWFYFSSVHTELFTAIVDLEPLLDTEEEIIRALDKYFEAEEQRLRKLKWLRSEYMKLNMTAKKDVSTFLSNPVNAYLLVKRLTTDWATTEQLIEGAESRAFIADITSQGYVFPGEEDLNGASDALMRLQDTYLLNTSQLARGEIQGAAVSLQLSAEDCFQLAFSAYQREDFYHSILWLQESLNQFESEETKTLKKSLILEYLALCNYMNGDIETAINITKEVIKEDPNNYAAVGNLAIYEAEVEREHSLKKGDTGDFENNSEDIGFNSYESEADSDDSLEFKNPIAPFYDNYTKLCRGERIKSPLEESQLYCQYTTKNNFYLQLQPVKEEILNWDPMVVVYHNVISDKDAEIFKELSLNKLKRATVSDPDDGHAKAAAYRVSKSAWLHDDLHPRIARASQLVEEISGLETETAEDLHVITYGIGGHYEPHCDFRKVNEADSFSHLGTGNRIATWIFYLSDVDAGGSTVFPDLGVEVKPEKGSACLWYNLRRNGEGILETKHAACPVLAGSKWVGNKWIHEYGQEFRRPCSLNQWE